MRENNPEQPTGGSTLRGVGQGLGAARSSFEMPSPPRGVRPRSIAGLRHSLWPQKLIVPGSDLESIEPLQFGLVEQFPCKITAAGRDGE